MATFPHPPVDLANRSGVLIGPDESYAQYDAVGRGLRDVIVDALPEDWDWSGKRVLDFGCGAGRTLRHFGTEATSAEFEGCDIDAPSVDWVNTHLQPFTAFVNDEAPPLSRADGSYDLIYALSVFTHITDQWSAWLLELRRLLKPGGLLIATFLGAGMSQQIAEEPWDPDRIGMNILRAHQSWSRGGPFVLLSPWWIHEHWGRAFDIVAISDDVASNSHGVIVARPNSASLDRHDLEQLRDDEPREIAALRHNLRQLQSESRALSSELDRAVRGYESSRSWRLTAPLRRITAPRSMR